MVPPRALPKGLTAPTQRGFSSRLIGDVIVDLGYASRAAVDAAVAAARTAGTPTGQTLVSAGTLTVEQLSRVVAERFGMDHVDLLEFPVDEGAMRLVPTDVARRYEALPIAFDDTTLMVAMAEPRNVQAADDIALLTGYAVRPVIAASAHIEHLLNRVDPLADIIEDEPLDLEASGPPESEELVEDAGAAPVVRLVHSLLQQAIQRGASDVHFTPMDGSLRGQFRIDGVLVNAATVPRRMVPGAISRIKIMADLDIGERRAPQDGRMSVTVAGRPIDVRVVTLPLAGGESVVMRILDRPSGVPDLDGLGMPEPERVRLERACRRTHGAVLVCGPTGAGKSTTLYAALGIANTGERSLITIEDPVEYRMDGIKQMPVNPRAGVSFSAGLRSVLRADPDVVMVGEVRDRETAQIAVEAALTGHLVLTSLHTTDAPGAITRLIEMGIEPFLVASSVRCVVAQRLARRLCEACRRPVRLRAAALQASGYPATEDIDAFEPTGCAQCAETGYRGRVGLYEVLDVDEDLHDMILARASGNELAAAGRARGMRPLKEVGLEYVVAGVTSASEVARVLGA
jgi:type IV pilus assembly protein PilB